MRNKCFHLGILQVGRLSSWKNVDIVKRQKEKQRCGEDGGILVITRLFE